MINLTKSKKGFLSIFWLAILMLMTTAIMVAATYSFSIYAATPTPILTAKFTQYYLAEFGIMIGKTLLDGGYTTNPGNGNVCVSKIVNINGLDLVTRIRCTSQPNQEYTITSYATTTGLTPITLVTLQADWRKSPNRIEQIY